MRIKFFSKSQCLKDVWIVFSNGSFQQCLSFNSSVRSSRLPLKWWICHLQWSMRNYKFWEFDWKLNYPKWRLQGIISCIDRESYWIMMFLINDVWILASKTKFVRILIRKVLLVTKFFTFFECISSPGWKDILFRKIFKSIKFGKNQTAFCLNNGTQEMTIVNELYRKNMN